MATTVLGDHVTRGSFSVDWFWLTISSAKVPLFTEWKGRLSHWYPLKRHEMVAYESLPLSRPCLFLFRLKAPPLLIFFSLQSPLIYSPFKNVFLCLLRRNVNYLDEATNSGDVKPPGQASKKPLFWYLATCSHRRLFPHYVCDSVSCWYAGRLQVCLQFEFLPVVWTSKWPDFHIQSRTCCTILSNILIF